MRDYKILDCTLRDGGYYTDWDFSEEILESYLNLVNKSSIDIIEVGYISPKLSGYFGRYFYLDPDFVKSIRKRLENCKLAVLINEKDFEINNVNSLASYCQTVDLIRIAVNPDRFDSAINLAKSIRKLGFEVAFNIMYASEWIDSSDFASKLSNLSGIVDIVYVVDSYGALFPDQIASFHQLMSDSKITFGFHGHNNLELAFANSLEALSNGVRYVDCTISGIGRGAGNLSTELILTYDNKTESSTLDFNALSSVCEKFYAIKVNSGWGASLPYMVSGINSLPQKKVMEWISQRYFSLSSIVASLMKKQAYDYAYPLFKPTKLFSDKSNCFIIGGGASIMTFAEDIVEYALDNNSILIFTSSRHVRFFDHLKIKKFHILIGDEANRLKISKVDSSDFTTCIVPSQTSDIVHYVPKSMDNITYQFKIHEPVSDLLNSSTYIAIELGKSLGFKKLGFLGYDGYEIMTKNKEQLFNENSRIFNRFKQELDFDLYSLTQTRYKELTKCSLYENSLNLIS